MKIVLDITTELVNLMVLFQNGGISIKNVNMREEKRKMKRTIKIIDLLNKMANGEEVPKKIKYDGLELIYSNLKQDYMRYYSNGNGDYLFQYLFDKCRNTAHFINDEVKIIEEPKKIDEIELDSDRLAIVYYDNVQEKHYMNTNKKDREVYIPRINWLIDKVNYLIEKSGKDECK